MKTITSEDADLMKIYTALLQNVGEQIRTIRKSQGESQIDLAACIESEKSVLSNIENGHSNVTLKTLAKISYSLEVDLTISLTNPNKAKNL